MNQILLFPLLAPCWHYLQLGNSDICSEHCCPGTDEWVSIFRIMGPLREKLASNVSCNVWGLFSPPCHGLAEVYFL